VQTASVCSKSRIYKVFLFFVIIFVLFTSRLVYIQFISSQLLAKKANRQYSYPLVLSPKRGDIYDNNMRRLACSLRVESLYAIPPYVKDKNETASALSAILKLDRRLILERLNRKKSFIWVKRKLSDAEVEKIKSLDIEGLGLLKEYKRFYPNAALASHVLGFVDIDNQGLEGLELFYDGYLKGENGWKQVVRDAKGRELVSKEKRVLPPQNGYNLILTIDEIIQHITETTLDDAWRKSRAKSAMAIVMDPKSGRILALANRPTFNPNFFGNVNSEQRRDRAITDYFEPGSAFKIVTASAALNEQLVCFGDVFFCENGSWKISGHMLHDHQPHGNLTFKEVIEKSSNIGTVKVALRLKEKALYEYIEKFKFGTPTGVDLPGEVSGILRPLAQWSKFSISSIPMGQEIGVTAMQMTAALSIIANGGLYYHPTIAKEIQDEKGQLIKSFEPAPSERVISEETAAKMRQILQGVVDSGTGKMAKPKSYTAGGKTGTAQKIEPSGVYSHSKFMASFIGFAPAEDPQIVICVFIDEPRSIYYGGVVAAPVFKDIAEESLKYLELEKNGILEAKK